MRARSGDSAVGQFDELTTKPLSGSTRHRAASRMAIAGGRPLHDIQRARWNAVAATSIRTARGAPRTPSTRQGMRTSARMRG